MIETLLTMTLTGTAVTLLWLAVCRLVGEGIGIGWKYRGLRWSMLFWLVPMGKIWKALNKAAFSGGAAAAAPVITGQPVAVWRPAAVTAAPATPSFSIPRSAAMALLAVWALGTVALLAKRLLAYHRFRKGLARAGLTPADAQARLMLFGCQQQVGVAGHVALCRCAAAPAPFVMGLLRPVIVLPEREFTRGELRCVLLHELTHVKQGDLWTRRLALVVTALHWWDPVTRLLERKLGELGEENCDARTAMPMDRQERYEYGLTLLKTACAEPMPSGMALSFSTEKNVKRPAKFCQAGNSEK